MTLRTSASILLLIACYVANAETPEIMASIEAGGNITIVQPAALDSLLTRKTTIMDNESGKMSGEATATRSGYRVQLFEDNNPRTARRDAESYHTRVQAEYPHIRSYISFNSPYWRVKAGDFRTRAEAESVLAQLRHSFPAIAGYMRVVRDKINIFD